MTSGADEGEFSAEPLEGAGYLEETSPDWPKPRRRFRMAGAAIGAVAILGGSLFAARGLAGGGPGSPEAAVHKLLSAAQDQDALGVLEALTPAERDSFKQPAVDLTKELQRLQILNDRATLQKVDGVSFEFND